MNGYSWGKRRKSKFSIYPLSSPNIVLFNLIIGKIKFPNKFKSDININEA